MSFMIRPPVPEMWPRVQNPCEFWVAMYHVHAAQWQNGPRRAVAGHVCGTALFPSSRSNHGAELTHRDRKTVCYFAILTVLFPISKLSVTAYRWSDINYAMATIAPNHICSAEGNNCSCDKCSSTDAPAKFTPATIAPAKFTPTISAPAIIAQDYDKCSGDNTSGDYCS